MAKVKILVDSTCGACEVVKDHYKNHPDVEFIDVNSPQSELYIGEANEILVPQVIFPDGAMCFIGKGPDGKFKALCGDDDTRDMP